MRIFRSPQNQIVLLEDVYEAGIAAYQPSYEIDYTSYHIVKTIGSSEPIANLMQYFKM
ncbi:MAG TPA: hypothetical protein V6C81_21835 [Planktothrix sp.]